MSRKENLPPNYDKLEYALRSIGYSFEVAVADIVDNSLDAKARSVLVRLLTNRDGHLDLAIWDDGCGMNAETLKEAMRFGADISRDIKRLGKFGLGLKLASLSQARELHVVTAVNGSLAGRAWLESGVASGFMSTSYDDAECRELIGKVFPDRKFKPSASMVLWTRLYRVGQYHGNVEEHAQKLMRRLENYLSIAFHRFLSGSARKVSIAIDMVDEDTGEVGIPSPLDPLDPFRYSASGQSGFPARMAIEGPYKDRIKMTAHIWPANSSSAEYKLPGGANSRQGFYFYRNDRLIQGGGWNGLRETEPHSSLARVEVDLAPEFDVEMSLDVKKVEIHLPQGLRTAIEKAKTKDGVEFKRYLALANETYRTRKVMPADLPMIPSQGLPATLVDYLHEELRLEGTARHRDLKFAWASLADEHFFDIDRENGYLYLNKRYRQHVLHGLPGSAADVPVLKCLLFLVLQDAISSERMGVRIRERVEQIDRILVRAVKHERTWQ
jgi:hypothetical protein